MIRLEEMPTTEEAPPSGACVRVERPEDGLARIVLDPPHRTLTLVFSRSRPALRSVKRWWRSRPVGCSVGGLAMGG